MPAESRLHSAGFYINAIIYNIPIIQERLGW